VRDTEPDVVAVGWKSEAREAYDMAGVCERPHREAPFAGIMLEEGDLEEEQVKAGPSHADVFSALRPIQKGPSRTATGARTRSGSRASLLDPLQMGVNMGPASMRPHREAPFAGIMLEEGDLEEEQVKAGP
jgi:heat shock protein HspQ